MKERAPLQGQHNHMKAKPKVETRHHWGELFVPRADDAVGLGLSMRQSSSLTDSEQF